MRSLIIRFLFCLFFAVAAVVSVGGGEAYAQKKGKISKNQSELKKLRREIKRYESRIRESKKKEKSLLSRLDDYDRQTALIRKLVNNLNEELLTHQHEIAIIRLNLVTAEKELRELQRKYARYVVSMYKRGRTRDTELLLSARSVNQMYIRARYLKAFTMQQRKEADEIRTRKKIIETQKLVLENRLQQQKQIIIEKRTEEAYLQSKLKSQKRLIGKVRQDKQSYEKQLSRRQGAARKIERLIADLINRERLRKLEANKKNYSASRKKDTKMLTLPSKPISQTKFGRLRGRLPWPVAKGAVVGFFGRQKNERLGTVLLNNGIDIRVPERSVVKTVADGTVSVVNYIAGFGNLIIIDHENDFYTVYAQLSEVNVKEDQKVKAGKSIARTGEGISGPQLHFELWRERHKQDPLTWLTHR